MRSKSADSSHRHRRCMTTPSQARRRDAAGLGRREGVETGRARPTVSATDSSHATYGQGTVQTTHIVRRTMPAKAGVVRKSAARKGIRVRPPVVPFKRNRKQMHERRCERSGVASFRWTANRAALAGTPSRVEHGARLRIEPVVEENEESGVRSGAYDPRLRIARIRTQRPRAPLFRKVPGSPSPPTDGLCLRLREVS